MLREHARGLNSLLLATDVLIGALVFAVLVSMPGMTLGAAGGGHPFVPLLLLGALASLIWPALFRQLGLYDSQRRLDLDQMILRLLAAGGIAVLTLSGVAFATDAPVARGFPIWCSGVQFAALGSIRLATYSVLRWLRRHGRNTRNVLIVGSGPRAGYVQDVLDRNPRWGLRIVGFIDDGVPDGGACVPESEVSKLPDMPDILRNEVVDEVIVACPRSMLASIVTVVDTCAAAGVPITLLSDLFGDYLPPPRVVRFGSLPALNFAPVHHNRAMLLVKRAIDLVGGACCLALAAPVLALAAIAIVLTSPGPVLFRQERCGLNGRRFMMMKLRTMYQDTDRQKNDLAHLNEMEGPVFKIRNDPRITPVGRLLRRFSIDELPQLWDVLIGQMSLVGPRPSLPHEVAEYQTFERRRLSMRPGLTCIWQVSGRNEIGFEDWVRLDLEYIDTWSLANDLRILVRTVPAVLRGTGAS